MKNDEDLADLHPSQARMVRVLREHGPFAATEMRARFKRQWHRTWCRLEFARPDLVRFRPRDDDDRWYQAAGRGLKRDG